MKIWTQQIFLQDPCTDKKSWQAFHSVARCYVTLFKIDYFILLSKANSNK